VSYYNILEHDGFHARTKRVSTANRAPVSIIQKDDIWGVGYMGTGYRVYGVYGYRVQGIWGVWVTLRCIGVHVCTSPLLGFVGESGKKGCVGYIKKQRERRGETWELECARGIQLVRLSV
jgi:hypothetical protein